MTFLVIAEGSPCSLWFTEKADVLLKNNSKEKGYERRPVSQGTLFQRREIQFSPAENKRGEGERNTKGEGEGREESEKEGEEGQEEGQEEEQKRGRREGGAGEGKREREGEKEKRERGQRVWRGGRRCGGS